MWRPLAIPVLAAVALFAQSTHEITGVLVDKATNQGIPGVTVFLTSPPDSATGVFLNEEAVTDTTGRFRFGAVREGVHLMNVPGAKGYQGGGARTTVSATGAREVVRIALDRSTDVRGDVIDADTREPVAGLGLFLVPLTYRDGRLIATYNGIRVNTDGEGRFRDSALSNGRYTAHVVPRLWATNSRHMTSFTAEDLGKVDEDYEESYWPGGADLDATLPQTVAAGAPVDFGTIRARKTTYYRARVRLTPGSCETNDRFAAKLFRVSGPDLIDEGAPFAMVCGQDLLLRGLLGGTSYSLALTATGQTVAQLKYATLSFTVTNANLDLLSAPAARGVDLEGRVVLAEGARSWPAKMRVQVETMIVRQQPTPAFLSGQQIVPLDAEGRFLIRNVPPGEKRLTVMDLGSSHVIQEVRLGGTRLAEIPERFNWQGRGSLEVVVDDQPAMITGSVRDGSREANQPLVVLVSWPSLSRGALAGDARGKFQFRGLRAGEYRVLAVPAEARERIEEPGVLDRLLSRAEKVTVERGGAVEVMLELLDPGGEKPR